MTNLVNSKANCPICLEPLMRERQIVYHENVVTDSGQTCDGSSHPFHLQCAITALQNDARCPFSKVPLNKRSIGLVGADQRQIDQLKHRKILTITLGLALTMGALLTAATGVFMASYSERSEAVDGKKIFLAALFTLACGVSPYIGNKIYEKQVNSPKFQAQIDKLSDSGAKMHTIVLKNNRVRKLQPSSGLRYIKRPHRKS